MYGFKKQNTKRTITYTKEQVEVLIDKKTDNHVLTYHMDSDRKHVQQAKEILKKYEKENNK